jgi:tetratricopeptide (TPR) repeat protein
MSEIQWIDLLGWTDEEVNDLRFVGYSYIKQGHYSIALKFFNALVVLCPDSSYDLQTLGALHLELGDNLTALNFFDRALQHDPKSSTTLINRAKALFLLGYHRQGLEQASVLKNHADAKISGQAEALILAYK